MSAPPSSPDTSTARAFARSWNSEGVGPVYTREQFLDWLAPIDPSELAGKDVIEMGFGNGSLLYYMGTYGPRRLCGIELGDTLNATRANLRHLPRGIVDLHPGDFTAAELGRFDLVYCIGVLHHLSDPARGFAALLRHARPGGRVHAWVYAREGNALVRFLVEPVRRVACRLPWRVTKYLVALPLVAPYYLYAKAMSALAHRSLLARRLAPRLPLGRYSLWIANRGFRFFHHVAFDQLVAPRTRYIRRSEVDSWLSDPQVDPETAYVIFRNGNSWKFGCRTRTFSTRPNGKQNR